MTPERARLVREGLTLLGYPLPPGDTWDARCVAALAAYRGDHGIGRLAAESRCVEAARIAAQERTDAERPAESIQSTPSPKRTEPKPRKPKKGRAR